MPTKTEARESAQRVADEFNRQHPVGAIVAFREGPISGLRTRSKAVVIDGTPKLWLAGYPFAVPLSKLEVIEEREE